MAKKMTHKITETVKTFFRRLLEEGDLEGALGYVSDRIVWVEAENYYSSKAALRSRLQGALQMFPHGLGVAFGKHHIREVFDTYASLTIEIRLSVNMDADSNFTMMVTVGCKETDHDWIIELVQLSAPGSTLEEASIQNRLYAEYQKRELLLNTISGGVALYHIRKDGRIPISYISEGLAGIVGYTSREFLEKYGEDSRQCVVPDDLPMIKEAIGTMLRTGNPISNYFRLYTKNGSIVTVRFDGNTIDMGEKDPEEIAALYAVQTLVSEKTELELAEQNRNKLLMNHLWIACCDWQRERGFFCSEAYLAYTLSDYSMEDVANSDWGRDAVHPDDLPILQSFNEKRRTKTEDAVATMRLRMKDGEYQWTEIIGFYSYDADGRLTRSIITLRDVDKQWEEKNRELQTALEEAQKANREKTRFLSRMSHDMRTPMNGILGIANLAKYKTDVDAIKADLLKIEESGKYLLSLINDTLDFQQIEMGKMTLQPQIIRAKELVSNIVDLIRMSAEEKHITLSVKQGNANLDWYVRLDPVRTKQIFLNLLSNAVKFTPEGGTVTLEFRLLKREGMISHDLIIIRDTGIGMSREFLEGRIFKPFSQESNEVTRQYAGSGLGLAIAKNLVEMMDGHMEVESEPGVGTSFYVYIDLERVEDEEAQKDFGKASKGREEATPTIVGKNVLLIEDNTINAEIVCSLLEMAGCATCWEDDGEKGVRRFEQEPPGTFDAILMDILMPVMDGLQAAKAIRALERKDAGRIPIIAMTANAFSSDIKASFDAGMNAHIAKPVDPDLLYRELAKYIAQNT